MTKEKPPAATTAPQTPFQQAVALHRAGQLDAAQKEYKKVLEINPTHFDAAHLLGVALMQQGQAEAATVQIAAALQINPDSAEARKNLGTALNALGRFDDALESFRRAAELKPEDAGAHSGAGNSLMRLKRFSEALAAYDTAQALRPQDVGLCSNRGSALRELGRLDEALQSFDAALKINPDDATALINRANTLRDTGRPHDALRDFDHALRLLPSKEATGVKLLRGHALRAEGETAKALQAYEDVLAVQPKNAAALYYRAAVLHALGDAAAARHAFDAAAAADAQNPLVFLGRAMAAAALKDFEPAVADFDRALALKPDMSEAFINRGLSLQALKRTGEAIDSYNKGLTLDPSNHAGLVNLGNALQDLKRFDVAIESYDRALQLQPRDVATLFNKGIALKALHRPEDALACYDAAFDIDPTWPYLESNRLHTRMLLCDWRDVAEIPAFLDRLRRGETIAAPFVLVGLPATAEDQLACARVHTRQKHPALPALWQGEKYTHEKIRIGYLSADLHRHATAYLMAGLFEQHDRNVFETIALSYGPDDSSDMRQRLVSAFDRFIDLRETGDAAAARLIRDMEIDILVDLKGFTQDSRVAIVAQRPAPLQVSYIGYPGTMGAPYIDYIIGDKTVIPDDLISAFDEKVVRLPNSYQPNDAARVIAAEIPSRASQGLPEDGFVFCCFNNNYKIMPAVFDIWMRLLRDVPNSVLWLFQGNDSVCTNLRREAALRGIDGARLVFAPKMKLEEHLARHRCADLFLDNLPCNAHTTASDALWSGLPVVTQAGNTFAGRVAASLLRALDMPELVTESAEEYETLARALAQDSEKLANLRKKLATARKTQPLFDTELSTRHLEQAYKTMWERQQAGLPPSGFDVPA